MFGSNIRVKLVRWLITGLATVVLLVALVVTGVAAQSQTEGSIRACQHVRTGVIVIDSTACPDDWVPLEWSNQGPQGESGGPGPAGTQGIQGRSGQDGDPGQDGAPGPAGIQGPQGDQGLQGLQGLPGVPGTAGPSSNATFEARISSLEAKIVTLEASIAENDNHIINNLDNEIDFLLGFINELRVVVFPGSSVWTR